MTKEDLLKQINTFLDESPFIDEEITLWKEKLPRMDEAELSELFNLLKEKLKIVTGANDLFTKIAEDLVGERDKSQATIPTKISIVDMSIDDAAAIFKSRILEMLKDESIDIFSELSQYFDNSRIAGANIIKEFDALVKALQDNEEILTKGIEDLNKITVGDWLKLYSAFNDKPSRKSIDRISFVNNDAKAKKLDKESKDIMLKLLKLYDFILNPANVEEELLVEQRQVKARTVSGPPKTKEEKTVEELQEIAKQYSEGSLERRAIQEEIRKLKVKS